VLNLWVSPGLLFSFSNFRFGLNFIYGYYNEDIESIIVRANTQMTFFSLHGLGTFVYYSANSYYRLYKQNKYGVNAQINYRSGGVNSLLGAKLSMQKENVYDGRGEGNASWSHVKHCSELRGYNLKVYDATVIDKGTFIHSFSLSLRIRQLLGTEIIQRLENDPNENYMKNWVTYGKDEKYGAYLLQTGLLYRFIKTKDYYRTNYTFDGGISYLYSNRAYYLPDQNENYENLQVSLGFGKSFYFKRSIFSVLFAFRYKRNLSGALELEDTTFIASRLTVPDFEYLTSHVMIPGAGVSYEIPFKKKRGSCFVRSRLDVYGEGRGDRGRTVFHVSTGIIF